MNPRVTANFLLNSCLYRGVDDTEYRRLSDCGFLSPRKPIGNCHADVLSRAADIDYIINHVLGKKTGSEKTCESFSFTRKEALRYATHCGSHDGWILSAPFVSICGGIPIDGRSQVSRPWLFYTDSSIWLIPGSRPPPKEMADLFKTEAEYRVNELYSLDSLPALEERRKREQQAANNSFIDFAKIDSNSAKDDEVLLLFGNIELVKMSHERVLSSWL